jgi:hypothetical protein
LGPGVAGSQQQGKSSTPLGFQAPIARIRAESREIFRDAVFLFRMPFWALRISSG